MAGPSAPASKRHGEGCVLRWLRGGECRRYGAVFQTALSFPLGNVTHGPTSLHVLFLGGREMTEWLAP